MQLRRKQCSSTLIDEDLPILSDPNLFSPSSSSSGRSATASLAVVDNDARFRSLGFRSDSRSSSNPTSPKHDEPETVTKRANIIREIYKTESDYLGHLKNLVEVRAIPLVDLLRTFSFAFAGISEEDARE